MFIERIFLHLYNFDYTWKDDYTFFESGARDTIES